MSRKLARTAAVSASALALALTLAACGSDDTDGDAAHGGDGHATQDTGHGSHDDHGEHVMNDPHATPADELDGAELRTGEFRVLDTAPPRSDDVAGTAWLAEDEDGTTVTARLSGLVAGDEYMLHLHADACDEDDGGPHFMFDEDGPEVPPNEIHLAFTADDEGAGEATVTNDRRVGDGAASIVIHPSAAMDNRIACADL